MFFQPRIGQHYHEGFKGYRTLVLGVKHHCILKQCPFYEDCVMQRNCANYDANCPAYGDRHDLRLSQSNQIEIDAFLEEYDRYPTYSYFTKLMLGKADDCTEAEKTAFWEQMAFANYLQYFCPSPQVPEYEEGDLTYRSEDWEAFLELLESVKPEVLLVWNAALKTLLDKKIAEGAIKGLTHFDDFRSETLTVNRYLYKVQPKKSPKELFADFQLAFCLDGDESTIARLMLNALQKARFRQFVPSEDLKLTSEMVEAAQPNIWDKELSSFLIGKLPAKQELDKLVSAFEPQLKDLAKNFRCASSFPLEIADTKAIDVGGKLSELSWFDLGKVGSLGDADVVILYLTDANDTLKACLKSLVENKLCHILLLLDVKDSDKLILEVINCPNLCSIVEKGRALLLQFDGETHEKVGLEYGTKEYYRRSAFRRGLSICPSHFLSAEKPNFKDLFYIVFGKPVKKIRIEGEMINLESFFEELWDRGYIVKFGKILRATESPQALLYGLYKYGITKEELNKLFVNDISNSNEKRLSRLKGQKEAFLYYKEKFKLKFEL